MNENTAVSLHIMLRRRREELGLLQAQVAETLRVSPECVTMWENGHRRMELSKLPRIAAALKLDARELVIQALAEFHPSVHEALFGDRAAA